IYDIVSNSADHTILKAAVDAAKLDAALKCEDLLTLFAPTDDAFRALPKGTVEALLEDPTGQLKQILLYHVVEGKTLSNELSDGQTIMTLQGQKVQVSIKNGHVYINNAKVTVADVMADNGVVHVINAVLLPPTNTIYDIVSNSADHTILKAAVDAAKLDATLKGEDLLTLFAPTDDAFRALPKGTVEALLEDPTGQLKQILLYHVVEGKTLSNELSDGQTIMTLQGQKVQVSIKNGHVYINNAKVTVADVMADNGVVHVINAVLDDQARMILSVNSFDLLSFNLSPNPAASSTRIILDNIYSGTMTLFVYNSLGKQVITKRINDPKDIILDVSDLQKGIYFVVLESNGTKKTRKLLVK
ncbi:MAG: fasciclin domain-containing protein, partial [Breznakibacter sp.]